MRLLLTGATGFIGRSLVPRLELAGHEVHAAVRKPVGLVHEHVVGEIGPGTPWSVALQGCEAVIHLASRVHVMRDTAVDALAANRLINTAGTLHLARQAVAAGVKRLVFASTIKVNGEGRNEPYTEHDRPDPQEAYAISKHEAEQGLWEIAKQTGMSVVILRFPLVYGPGVGANFLKLLQTIHRGMPLPLGAITNRRSLVYVGNLVDAVATVLVHPAAANRTYLVSDGEDVSTPELIRQIAVALGRPARLLSVPTGFLRLLGAILGKKMEVDRLLGSLCVDSTALHRELEWAPPYTMRQGLAATAEWYRGQIPNRHA